MASTAVTSSVSATVVPLVQLSHGKTHIPRQGHFLAAPGILVNSSRVVMSAAPITDTKIATLTALAVLVTSFVPEIAEAAQPGVSPSLKNLLLSVVAGGTVLTAIGVAVAGVSTFDPVKRK